MTQHTPGPWIATCDNDDTEEANAIYAGDICIAHVGGEDEIRRRMFPGPVEPIGCTAGSDAMDEVDANARLMAAAPELKDRLDRLQRAAVTYLMIRDQREADEDEYAAAGYTYCQEQLEHAEQELRKVLREIAKVVA
jgi:hypothetical protein